LPAHNNIFAPGGVDVWLKVLLSLLRSVLGTGRSFKFPPDRKYLRWAILRVRISEIAFYKVLFSLFIYKVAEGTLEERR
jgi:hypothetical protein